MIHGLLIGSFLVLLLICGTPVIAQTQTVEAFVDSTIIHVDETFRLTIKLTERAHSNVSLDLNPLLKDFDLLGTTQNSQSMNLNGQPGISTEWIITLAPKRLGKLVIPQIQVGKQRSQPITVTVLSLEQA